ncbi:MAG: hypothetical protein IJ192_04960 [Clostridia bacterium]|nr:hypothetical protein [Clostridia bacterium]
MTVRKIFIIGIVFLNMMLMCSCRKESPETAQQELAAHKWSLSSEQGKYSLTFEDDSLTLAGKMSDSETFDLRGKYFADDSRLTVVTEEYGTVDFDYVLENEKLKISCFGMEVVFLDDN